MLVQQAFVLEELAAQGEVFGRTALGRDGVSAMVAVASEATGVDGRVSVFRLLPAWDEALDRHYLWSVRAALVAGAAARAYAGGGGSLPHAVHDGDYLVGAHELRVVCASLEIGGRLLLEHGARLVVLGDLYAADSIELGPDGGLDGYFAQVACGGDVHVAQLLSTGGWFTVAGTLNAAVVCAYGNQGALIVAGDLHARVLYERDHHRSIVAGHVDAGAAVVDTMLDGDGQSDRLLDLVRPELRPRLRRALDDDDFETVEDLLQQHALAGTLLATG